MTASLDNIFGEDTPTGAAPAATPPVASATVYEPSLDDIFGAPPVAAAPAPRPKTSLDNIFNTPVPKMLPKPQISYTAQTLPKPQMVDSSTLFKDFFSHNAFDHVGGESTVATMPKTPNMRQLPDNSVLGIVRNTIKDLPEAAVKVSKAINDAVIVKPANLLANTKFIQEAGAGIEAGDTSGLFAEQMLHKLSYGLESISGLTGGLYKAPENPTEDFTDKALQAMSQGVGMAVGMSSLGSGIMSGIGRAGLTPVPALGQFLSKYPLAAKYIGPLLAPLAENVTGFAAYGQLDPNLGADMHKRVVKLGTDIATAPLYTALGAIKNAGASVPTSFGLGYGMAKLSGAENDDALAAGFAFAFLDGFGRTGTNKTRGFTKAEIEAKLQQEAIKALQPFSKTILGKGSSLAELKAAYYVAAHATHPDLGGTSQKFNAIKSAYDLLSKGRPTPEADKSVELLHNSIRESLEKNGDLATESAIQEHLGLDPVSSSRLINAAKTPKSDKDILKIHGKLAEKIINTRTDEQIKIDAVEHVKQNEASLVKKYVEEHGNLVGADEAKELMPGYSTDRSTSDLVQKGASQLADKIYTHLLEARQGKGNGIVLMTAGGTSVGKSTALRAGGINPKEYGVVFDTNLTDAKSGISRIQQALDKGFEVDIHYVYATPEQSYERAIERTERMAQEKGSGRPIAPQGHIDMHHKSYDAVQEIMAHFKDEPRVRIAVSDNSGDSPVLIKRPLDFIKEKGDNRSNEKELHDKLHSIREQAHKDGKISDKTNAAFDRAGKLRPRREEPQIQQESQAGDKEPTSDVLAPAPIIHEVTPEPVKGTGDKKIRGLAEGIEANAIQKQLTDNFGGLPEYEQVSMKQQAELAAELLKNDYELAKKVALGTEPAPAGLLPEMVLVAVENKAIIDRDIETLRMLATASELNVAGTTMGQRIRALGERDADSPVKAITEVAKAREKKVVKKVGDIKKAKTAVVKEIKKKIKDPTLTDWDAFIDTITC